MDSLVKKALFVKSSAKIEECPVDGINEYAFIGRSNVGKSSLINMLTGQNGMAKVSQTPGKTQLINHYLINGSWYLVDLPGYGFAKTSKASRAIFQAMITNYIRNRETLINLFVLVDSRLEPQKVDLEFISSLGESQVPFTIVFTKADKISKTALQRSITAYQEELLKEWDELPTMIATSAESKLGREEVIHHIDELNRLVKEEQSNPS